MTERKKAEGTKQNAESGRVFRLLLTAYCLLNLRYPDSAFEWIEVLESYHDNDGHYHSGDA